MRQSRQIVKNGSFCSYGKIYGSTGYRKIDFNYEENQPEDGTEARGYRKVEVSTQKKLSAWIWI